MRLLRRLHDVCRLRTFLALGDLELYLISFLQALITLRIDRTVMNKDIRSIRAPDEAVPRRVIEPLYGSFQAFHEPLYLHLDSGREDVPAVHEMHFGAQGFVLSRHSRPKPWCKITYNRMFRD